VPTKPPRSHIPAYPFVVVSAVLLGCNMVWQSVPLAMIAAGVLGYALSTQVMLLAYQTMLDTELDTAYRDGQAEALELIAELRAELNATQAREAALRERCSGEYARDQAAS